MNKQTYQEKRRDHLTFKHYDENIQQQIELPVKKQLEMEDREKARANGNNPLPQSSGNPDRFLISQTGSGIKTPADNIDFNMNAGESGAGGFFDNNDDFGGYGFGGPGMDLDTIIEESSNNYSSTEFGNEFFSIQNQITELSLPKKKEDTFTALKNQLQGKPDQAITFE